MSKGKGWFLESRRHKLSALGIKTGRKMLPKRPISLLVGDQKMFYPAQKTVKQVTKKTLVDSIVAYESGHLSNKEGLELFSYLVKSGQAWSLQGHYGRTATRMMKEGYIDKEGKILKKGLALDYTNPKDVIKASMMTPIKTISFKNVKTAVALRGKLQKEGKLALLGSKELNGKRIYFVEVFKGKGTSPLSYTKNNRTKKIVKGALIGATVGALAYKKGEKKMKKKLNYNDDVTYDPVTAEPLPIPKKEGFFKKVGRGAVAVGRGAKATFEKGQEIGAKLRKIQEEREVREIAQTQRQLLKAQSQLQVVKQKKLLEATKKEIEAGRKSILPKIF